MTRNFARIAKKSNPESDYVFFMVGIEGDRGTIEFLDAFSILEHDDNIDNIF